MEDGALSPTSLGRCPACYKTTYFHTKDVTNQHAWEVGPHEQFRDGFQGVFWWQVKFTSVCATSEMATVALCLPISVPFPVPALTRAASWIWFRLASNLLFQG